jgi:predicted transcriptional regulator
MIEGTTAQPTMTRSRTPRLPSKKPAADRPAPVSLRLDPDLQELWDRLAVKLQGRSSKHAIAVAALRAGLAAIEKDPSLLYQMEQEALKARWEGLLPEEGK